MTEVDKIVERVRRDFPGLRFRMGKKFMYRFPGTITYERTVEGKMNTEFGLQLLHEIGHAICEHKFFTTDPERLKMEREAWEVARRLSVRYEVDYDAEFVEQEMDTYRDWLHQRSKCRRCGLTRYQTKDGVYHCPRCEAFGGMER